MRSTGRPPWVRWRTAARPRPRPRPRPRGRCRPSSKKRSDVQGPIPALGSRRGRVAQDDDGSEVEHVAVGERVAIHAVSLEDEAVEAVGILDDPGADLVVADDFGVKARDGTRGDGHVVAGMAPDGEAG